MTSLAEEKDGGIDEEALAEAYNRALTLEKSGDYEAAASAYQEVLRLDPDDHGGAAVRLASIGRGETPPKAPDAYVTTLFDQHAGDFENILVDQLGYGVPDLVRKALQKFAPGNYERLLDLGCGTGLSGETLCDMAAHVTGVDLSENMLELAEEKDVYDELYVGEVVDFLESVETEPYDLVTATDVLPYMGHLEGFFAGAASVMARRGILAFSTETLPTETFEGRPFMVGPHQRFAHAEAYLRGLMKENGFACLAFRPITVRHEQGKPVRGHLVIARKL